MTSNYFIFTILACIIINTVILSLDSYPASHLSDELSWINSLFSGVFIIELFCKLLGLGFKQYFTDTFNLLDCCIVIASVVDIVTQLVSDGSSKNVGTALRGFRVISIFKLAKSWRRFQHLLKTIWRTLVDISTFTIVLFLFMFLFTILGMEIFAYRVKFDNNGNPNLVTGSSPWQNFDNFEWAFTSVFVLLTGDSWGSDIWVQLYRATEPWRSTIYVFVIYIIGNRILLNLFLAILLQNFDEDSIEQALKQELESAENAVSS